MNIAFAYPSTRFGSRLIILIALVLSSSTLSFAQRSFYHISVENGLASTVVHDILIDHRGYLWIATEGGLNRYDGKNLKLFTTNEGLGGNEILKIMQDSKNRIWFLSFNGIASYYQNDQFYNPANTPFLKEISSNATLNNIYEDDDGTIWVVNEAATIFKISDSEVTKISSNEFNLGNIRQVWRHQNWMYFGSLSGLYRWKIDEMIWEQVDDKITYWSIRNFVTKDGTRLIPNQHGITTPELAPDLLYSNDDLGINTSIHSVLVTKRLGVLVIGTIQDGVKFYLDFSNDDLNPSNSWLENETISSTIMDNEGSVWISTLDNGIYRVDRGFNEFQYLNEQNGLNHPAIRSSLITSDNHIWFGGKDGTLYRVNEEGEINFKTTITQTHILNTSIESLSEPKPGELLIGTIGGVYKLDFHDLKQLSDLNELGNSNGSYPLKKFDQSYSVKAIIGKEDTLYVGSNRHLYRYSGDQYSKKEILTENRITALEFDRNNKLYIGMLDGLYLLEDDQITKDDSPLVLNTQILDIQKLYGTWIGISTYGNGLILKCTQTGAIRQFTTENGLTSNLVKSTFFDNSGNLWIVTNLGINKIRIDTTLTLSEQPAELQIISYSWSDGLNIDQINQIDVTNNKVWISGNRGITLFSKDFLGYEIQKIPLIVEEITVNGIPFEILPSYNVGYKENQWEINFTGIYLRDGSKINYRYRIPELSPEWITTTTGNINLRYLNPGSYTLELEAFTLDNRIFSDPYVLHIVIDPPFWQTSWFIVLIVLIVLALIIQLIRWSVKTEIESQKMNHENAVRVIELEHQALMAMMKPHTIYNQISALQFLLFSGNTDRARDMIMKFTKLLRLQLDSTFKKSNSLEDEINRIKLQLELDSEKFENKLEFKFEYDPIINPKKCLLPSLILQPFIENSINHGLLNKIEHGKIRVESYLNQYGQLVIAIEDNGVGFREKETYYVNSQTPIEDIPGKIPNKKIKAFEVQQSPSIGLHLFIERIRLIALEQKLNWEITFSNIRDKKGDVTGALVLMTLPIIPNTSPFNEG